MLVGRRPQWQSPGDSRVGVGVWFAYVGAEYVLEKRRNNNNNGQGEEDDERRREARKESHDAAPRRGSRLPAVPLTACSCLRGRCSAGIRQQVKFTSKKNNNLAAPQSYFYVLLLSLPLSLSLTLSLALSPRTPIHSVTTTYDPRLILSETDQR